MITGYRYRFPVIVIQNSVDLPVTMLSNWSTSGYPYPEISQLPSNDTQQSTDQKKIPEKLPGNNSQNLSTSRYCYLAIDQFPGNNTCKSVNRRVLLPGNRYEKKTFFCEYLHKNENMFKNILGCCSGQRYYM